MEIKEIGNFIIETLEWKDFYHKNKFKSVQKIATVLRKKTALRYSKSFPRPDLFYMYNPEMGIYHELSHNELIVLLNKIFSHSKIDHPSINTTENISKYLRLDDRAYIGEPIYDTDHIVFTNCVYDLKTNEIKNWTPDIFITYRLPFPYSENAICPAFLEFINQFCGGHEDRIQFLLAPEGI